MESSNPNEPFSKIYDLVRRQWVKKTPEEIVRQKWLGVMLHELDFPLSLIAVEKELSTLPHLSGIAIPKRRADIIVYTKTYAGKLVPLLIVECKVHALTQAFIRQVVGYNASVQAPFVAVANENVILIGSFNAKLGSFQFAEGLLSYRKMQSLASNVNVVGQ